MEYIPLKDLHHTDLNVRTNPEANTKIDSLKASIAAHGLLQPLVVVKNGKGYKVIAGGRRLAALHALKWKQPVPVTVIDEAQAREASLAENLIRRNLDPIEIYEAIAAMGDEADELTQKELAARFGQPIDYIRKAQRLGRVHPTIREAYRSGAIKYEVIEAFAASPDQAEQLAVYEDLSQEKWGLSPHRIKSALGFGDWDTKRALEYVGQAAYKKAGGEIETDLFSDSLRVSDVQLLNKLADDKRAKDDIAEAAKLGVSVLDKADGWQRAYLNEKADEATEQRIEEIEDTLFDYDDDLPEENRKALEEELEACLAKRVPVLNTDEYDYGYYHGSFYHKRKPLEQKADENTVIPAEPEGIQLSGRAQAWLQVERQTRFRNTVAADPNHENLNALLALSVYKDLAGNFNGWTTKPEDVERWNQLRRIDTTDLEEMVRHLVLSRYSGKPCAVYQAVAAECEQLPWQSTPEFWDLFRSNTDLLELAEDIHPDLVPLLKGGTAKGTREYLHKLCSGELPKTAQVSGEVRTAAQAWVPRWLRFVQSRG